MEEPRFKNGLEIVTAEAFNQDVERYELRKGDSLDALSCPYGNQYNWVVFDKLESKYVRVTKSVFKRLVDSSGSK